MPLVFVYGTLKKGFPNHKLLGKDSKFIGTDTMLGALYFLGHRAFPYAFVSTPWFRSATDSRIHGEVYDIDTETVRKLDDLEGHPNHYVRIETKTDKGHNVHVYTASLWTYEHASWMEQIPRGNYDAC